MRTTVTLADDVAAAVENARRERSLGFSEAVNELIRAGLVVSPSHERKPFVQTTHDLGVRIDVTNVAGVLDLLDQESPGSL